MSQADLLKRLEGVFESIFDDDVPLTRETTAEDVEGWDSVAHIRLILAIEQEFGIKFSAAEVGEAQNVGELVDMIERKI